jgi:hypothetical protein
VWVPAVALRLDAVRQERVTARQEPGVVVEAEHFQRLTDALMLVGCK